MCKVRTCPLWRKAIEVPFEKGRRNEIVWIGESPGYVEEREGLPFRGPAGKLHKSALAEAGLDYADFFTGNSARCLIDKKKLTGKQITAVLASCREKAIAPIKLLRPKAVVVMGDLALRQILKKSGITKHRGRWVWSEEFNCWVLPVFHPAHILRHMGLRRRLIEDYKMVGDFIKNKFSPPKVSEDRLSGYREASSIESLIDKWSEEKATISIDTESQGKDWMDPNFVLISYSLSPEEGKAIVVVLYEEVEKGNHDFTISWARKGNGKKLEKTEIYVKRSENFHAKLQSLARLLSDKNIKKYMMHGNHDIHCIMKLFERERLPVPAVNNYVMDIQAAANILDENLFKLPSLEDLQMAFTSVREDYKSSFQKKYDVGDMFAVPRKEMIIYAASDADVTRRVGISIKNELSKKENERLGRYLVKFTMPALSFLRTLETNGALIDRNKLPKVTQDVYKIATESEDRALSLIPKKVLADFGITKSTIVEARKSGKFFLTKDALLSEALFGDLGFKIPGIKKTSSNESWSIGKEVRVALLDRDIPEEAKELIEAYDDFADAHTMYSRYLKGFERDIKSDGRIHSSYSLAATVIGRTASRNPNMQNTPKRSQLALIIRELIVAPPGYVLMAVDGEQAELRWAAEYSGDEELIRIFKNKLDPHGSVALEFLQRKDKTWTQERWQNLDPRQKELERRKSKCVNFGLLFGMTASGLVGYARKDYGLKLSESEAEEWRAAWFGKFKKIGPYQRRMIQLGRELGYVESILGRRRRLPELKSQDRFVRLEAERQAIHHPISSASSDSTLLSGREAEKEIKDRKAIRPILFTHDELVFEVKEKLVDEWRRVIVYHMEHPPLERDFNYKMRVPLSAEVKVGENLASLRSL